MTLISYNIALVGAAGSGKTTYLNRLQRRAFNGRWIPSNGREDRTLEFSTTNGPVRITFNEYAGLEYYSISQHLEHTDAVIYMYDVTNMSSLTRLNDMKAHFPGIPSLLVANKVDINPKYHEILGVPKMPATVDYTRISCKRGENLTEPALTLLRKLSGNSDMMIV